MPTVFVANDMVEGCNRTKYTDCLDTVSPDAWKVDTKWMPSDWSLQSAEVQEIRETIEGIGWIFCWEVGEEFYETPEED